MRLDSLSFDLRVRFINRMNSTRAADFDRDQSVVKPRPHSCEPQSAPDVSKQQLAPARVVNMVGVVIEMSRHRADDGGADVPGDAARLVLPRLALAGCDSVGRP